MDSPKLDWPNGSNQDGQNGIGQSRSLPKERPPFTPKKGRTPPLLPSPGRRGSHTTARELQMCTFQGPCASKHHQNSTKRPPRVRRKKENCGGGGKKARNLGPHPSGPHPSVPHLWLPYPSVPHPSGPHFSGFGPPTLRGPHPWGPHHYRFAPMFFCPVCVFLSRMQIFVLSRQQVAYLVLFSFYLSRGVFFVPTPVRRHDGSNHQETQRETTNETKANNS